MKSPLLRSTSRKVSLIVAVLALLGFAAVKYPGASILASKASAPEVQAVPVVRQTLTVEAMALGTIKPKVGAEVKVGSRLSGVVDRLMVGVGDEVKEGQLLAQLDDAPWRVRVEVLTAELAQAKAELEYAEREYSSMRKVPELSVLSVENSRRNLAVKAATVEQTQGRLDEAKIQLSYARITAPVSGTIASVSTYEGETVAASFSAPTFVTILNQDRLEVHTFVDESDIRAVHRGLEVRIRVDAYPGKTFRGVVNAIHPKAELINNVVNYVAVVDIVEKGDAILRPEMTAHVNFVLEEQQGALSVPRSAVLRDQGRNFVIARTSGGWKKTPVDVGLLTQQRVALTSGVEEGASVMLDAQQWGQGQAGELR